MSDVVVEVPAEEVERFQLWLASQVEEVTHGVADNGGASAIGIVKDAKRKLNAVDALLEQGARAADAGKAAEYRGDAQVLLWNCHAMADDYTETVKILGSAGPYDFAAIEKALEPLARWVKACREIQESNPEAVSA